METEKLVECLEEVFGGLRPPQAGEMAAASCSVDANFIRAVRSKTWQELRPLHQYVGDARELASFSAEAYQYYLAAFLYAVIRDADYDRYLSGLLNSLWYENWKAVMEAARERYRVPSDEREAMSEIEREMPSITPEERKVAAESRFGVAKKLAKLTEISGRDWADVSHHRRMWDERMAVLTHEQKRCIAKSLVHILERRPHPNHARRIQAALDGYWRAFLAEAEG
jgi:hypothetical protein